MAKSFSELKESHPCFGSHGATTGRPRRTGWLDMVALKKAIQLNGLTGLALTKMDVLNTLQTIRICVAYKLDGRTITDFPSDVRQLTRCIPVWEELPGWNCDISAATAVEQLPAAAQSFIARIEELSGCPVILISVGPRRDQTIQVQNPFETGKKG